MNKGFRFNKEQDTLEEVNTPVSDKENDSDKEKEKSSSRQKCISPKDGKPGCLDDLLEPSNASPRTWRLFKEKVQQAVEDIKRTKEDESDKDDISEGSTKDHDDNSILDKFKNKKRAYLSKLKKDTSPYKVSPTKIIEKEDHIEKVFTVNYKPVEIESGVEMVEDMVFVQSLDDLPADDLPIIQSAPRPPTPPPPPPQTSYLSKVFEIMRDLFQKESFLFAVLSIVVTMVLNLTAFCQGFLLALFLMLAYRNVCEALTKPRPLEKALPPRKQSEAIEEHKPIKTYTGWMNQIDTYNLENYHVSNTQSVFVTIDGTVLRLSYTKMKISKRHLWNDKNKRKPNFIKENLFDLHGAIVELWPRGLARKRYYNRKYPIKVTITSTNDKLEEMVKFRDSFEDESDNDKTDSQISIKALDLDTTEDFKDCIEDNRQALFLFARCDREKEDWLRRLMAASRGDIFDYNVQPVMMAKSDSESKSSTPSGSPNKSASDDVAACNNKTTASESIDEEFIKIETKDFVTFDNIISPCASRTSADFVEFVMHFVKRETSDRKPRDSDLPSGYEDLRHLEENVFWTNLVIGRILYGIIHDSSILSEIHSFLQKKLSAIKLPTFMEEVNISDINLGNKPPFVHKIYPPTLDERGAWIDADITYEGLVSAALSTKLNLMRLRKQETETPVVRTNSNENLDRQYSKNAPEAIYDSDAESTGESSSESEEETSSVTEPGNEPNSQSQPPANKNKRILRIVNKITGSNLFQSATEISYIQRAMENMSTNLKLRVELKSLTARIVINLPSPPSDRCWMGFREPPRLSVSAKPTVGETSFDWSIVTSTIENKMCDEIYKYLVYPNLVDVLMPVLGLPTYKE